jgi:hypothetical protein
MIVRKKTLSHNYWLIKHVFKKWCLVHKQGNLISQGNFYGFLNRWNSTITTCFWTTMVHNALNSTLPWLSTCWTLLCVCFLWPGKRIGTLIVNMLNIFCVCFLWQGKRTSTLIVNMLNIFCVCASFGKGRELVLWLSTCWTFFVWVFRLAGEDNCRLVIDLL